MSVLSFDLDFPSAGYSPVLLSNLPDNVEAADEEVGAGFALHIHAIELTAQNGSRVQLAYDSTDDGSNAPTVLLTTNATLVPGGGIYPRFVCGPLEVPAEMYLLVRVIEFAADVTEENISGHIDYSLVRLPSAGF